MRLVFDRGTIVFRGDAPAVSLPGARWDPRIEGYRAQACRHREILGALASAGSEFRDDVRRPQAAEEAVSEPALRPYQEAALRAWQDASLRGIVALPTGSGKTRLAVAAMARLGCATLCVVPTRVLLEQWRSVLGGYVARVGCYGNGDRVLAPITVATYASAERHMPQIGNRFDLLVIDEAHHAIAESQGDLFSMCTAPARLGLTATPPRGADGLAALAEHIGPVVYERALGDLAGRFLAPFDVRTIRLDLEDAERERYRREMTCFREVYGPFRERFPSASWAEFVKAADRTNAGKRAVAAWRRAQKLLAYTEAKRQALAELLDFHAGARVLIFTADNASAYAIARERLVMPITCDIGKRERQRALAMFATGELKALVSARVLNEGIDVPDADIAIIVGGSLGEREHVQRVGRLLRPVPGKRAVVYELVTRASAEVGQNARRRRGLASDVAL